VHQRAKFRVDRLDLCRDVAVFRLFIMAAVRHLEFLKVRNLTYRSDREGQYAFSCQILRRSVELLRRYGRFLIFQDGGRPPSWICFTCICTTHEMHLLVFVTVQNLVGIGALVLIIPGGMPVLMFCLFGLKMPIYAPFWVVLGDLNP